jgi:mannose-1-phosphate guanylyltransferase
MPATNSQVSRSRNEAFGAIGPRGETEVGHGAQALILAGGDGTRLRPLTRELAGDDRPKQFVSVVGEPPLLELARRRAALLVPPWRTQIVLTRPHEAYFRELLEDAPPSSLAVQPSNRGTGVAVLYALLRAAKRGPDSSVVILPSDHWVSDERAFMAHVAAAVGVVEAHSDAIVLLAFPPTRAEAEYGWIEAAEPIFGWRSDLRRVRQFVEKPGPERARALRARGFLWASFVVVGRISRLLLLYALTLPALVDAFVPVWNAIDSASEAAALAELYAGVRAADLSGDVLARLPEMLSVLEVSGVFWEDLGNPRRVREARKLAAGGVPAAGELPA